MSNLPHTRPMASGWSGVLGLVLYLQARYALELLASIVSDERGVEAYGAGSNERVQGAYLFTSSL